VRNETGAVVGSMEEFAGETGDLSLCLSGCGAEICFW